MQVNRKISKDRVKSMYEIDKKKFGTFDGGTHEQSRGYG